MLGPMSAVSEREPVETRACPQCDAGAESSQRFCTDCGASLNTSPSRPVDLPSDQTARLVECENCGSGNARSRPLCAVCSTPLRDEVPGGDALPEDIDVPLAPVPDSGSRRDVPTLVLALVILAALVTAGVILSLLSSRMGTFEDDAVPTGVALQAASASTSLGDHPASLAIDGDITTSWTEAAQGPGEDQWIEVTMAEPASVRRILLWNGDQRDEERFDDNGRAASIRIDVEDRQFRVAVIDTDGPQSIELPEAVTTDRVRITIEEAIGGTRYTDLAITEVVVEAAQ